MKWTVMAATMFALVVPAQGQLRGGGSPFCGGHGGYSGGYGFGFQENSGVAYQDSSGAAFRVSGLIETLAVRPQLNKLVEQRGMAIEAAATAQETSPYGIPARYYFVAAKAKQDEEAIRTREMIDYLADQVKCLQKENCLLRERSSKESGKKIVPAEPIPAPPSSPCPSAKTPAACVAAPASESGIFAGVVPEKTTGRVLYEARWPSGTEAAGEKPAEKKETVSPIMRWDTNSLLLVAVIILLIILIIVVAAKRRPTVRLNVPTPAPTPIP